MYGQKKLPQLQLLLFQKNKLTTSPEIKSKIGKLDVRDFDEDAARTLYQIAYEAKNR